MGFYWTAGFFFFWINVIIDLRFKKNKNKELTSCTTGDLQVFIHLNLFYFEQQWKSLGRPVSFCHAVAAAVIAFWADMPGKRVFVAAGRTWLRVRKWSNNRKVWTGKQGREIRRPGNVSRLVSLRRLPARVPPDKSEPVQVRSRGDLAQPGTVKFCSGSVPWDSTYRISPPAAMLTKTIKRSQRSAEENDSRLAPRIYCVKTNYDRVVLKMSHLDRLATNKSLHFGL